MLSEVTADSGPKLVIRDAGPADLDAVVKGTLAAYQQYAADNPLWEAYRANIVATLTLGGSLQELIMAEIGGQWVGSVLLLPPSEIDLLTPAADVSAATGDPSVAADSPEVRLLAVHPDHRASGIGQALMEVCIQRTRDRGFAFLSLHTTDFMRSALRLYERIGFIRFPATDFSPSGGVLVQGFRLPLSRI